METAGAARPSWRCESKCASARCDAALGSAQLRGSVTRRRWSGADAGFPCPSVQSRRARWSKAAHGERLPPGACPGPCWAIGGGVLPDPCWRADSQARGRGRRGLRGSQDTCERPGPGVGGGAGKARGLCAPAAEGAAKIFEPGCRPGILSSLFSHRTGLIRGDPCSPSPPG